MKIMPDAVQTTGAVIIYTLQLDGRIEQQIQAVYR